MNVNVRNRKSVLFITNIPAPYRIDFFNELGRYCNLTVVFEARRAAGVRFNWNDRKKKLFRAIFLSDGEIDETHVNWKIFSYLDKDRYDRIIATSYGYYTEMAALLWMRLRRIPYDLELDGGIVRPGEPFYKRLIKRRIIRGAGHLFSSGKETDSLFLHYGGQADRLVRYPFTSLHAADVRDPADAEEKAEARRQLGLKEEMVIVSIGQFIRRKGYDVLLKACSGLDPKAGVHIIGGSPTEEYRALVSGYSLKNVAFHEFMDKASMQRFLRAADLFVLPTREDMWGLVVNEAMAAGLPVVTTTACNAGKELIEDGVNGFLVPPENPDALRDTLNGLIAAPHTMTVMGRNNSEKMRTCTIEEMARIQAEYL